MTITSPCQNPELVVKEIHRQGKRRDNLRNLIKRKMKQELLYFGTKGVLFSECDTLATRVVPVPGIMVIRQNGYSYPYMSGKRSRDLCQFCDNSNTKLTKRDQNGWYYCGYSGIH
jgi:hypothetical protein